MLILGHILEEELLHHSITLSEVFVHTVKWSCRNVYNLPPQGKRHSFLTNIWRPRYFYLDQFYR